ncbi:CYTH domain-containing protein [Agrobacterium sp. rho-13.3]|jgi:CYTH domain-containing protein|uniref:CYTH domain-containing protein n=1 Tax=Agrobacterium sp. rho-13.3 TaxID=3072980 RepID=UPI002A11F6C7|nr:CYTH domain-containing protein [Agrobacterium sp. rho-13.3]MDX8307650.1 CYTH domain-containing protein [Agrobacterium sp. rho-13.3]
MAKEIERKFLVRSDSWRGEITSQTPFRQGYIVSLEDRSVRVRIKGDDAATLTIKIGASSLMRDEYEYDIAVADAQELLSTSLGIVIEKTRFTVDHEGFVWEIDVFEGLYSGLIVAEVELNSETDQPALPAWLGPEVTGDRRYSNQYLATDDLSAELCHVLQG